MTKEDFIAELENLFQNNNIDSYNKAIEIIDEELKKDKLGIDKGNLEAIKRNAKIGIINLEIGALQQDDYKNELHLRGKLINLYKQAEKYAVDSNVKMKFRYQGLQELKKQKEIIKKYKHDGNTKISVPEKVALTVKDISKTIEIFLKEKDVLTKVKNVGKETIASATGPVIIMGAIGLALQHALGVPFSLVSLASVAPVVAYAGLASIIRNVSTKTPFQQYVYQQSDEYKALVTAFTNENKDKLDEISKIVKEKGSCGNIYDKIDINDQLIKKLDELAASTKIDGIRDTFELQALGYMRENKEYCEQIKDDYLDEKNDDKEAYKANNKKLMKINLEIFKRENSIKEAIRVSGENTLNNMKVILIAKLILSQVAPATFPLTDLNSLLIPFAFAIINGVIDIPTYKNKLKYRETEYHGKINSRNKERIEEILETKRLEPVLA